VSASLRTLADIAAALAHEPRLRELVGEAQVKEPSHGVLTIPLGDGQMVLTDETVFGDPARGAELLSWAAEVRVIVGCLGSDEATTRASERLQQQANVPIHLLGTPIAPARLASVLMQARELLGLRVVSNERGRVADRFRLELGELVAISRAISSERDIGRLLGLILEKSRYITDADAGSVYIVEGMTLAPHERTLRFMISQNDSLAIDFREFTLPVDEKSIVGHAVLSRKIINIPNLYELDQPDKNPWGFRHDKSFDKKLGYQGRSMLTVPMINQKDEVIGVIQLINRRRPGAGKLRTPNDFDRFVIPFDGKSEELSSTLASQAGISLENTLLYEDIRRLFDGFVNAAVTAIESRDPTTSGHSHRVAKLTVGLAEMVGKESTGPYAGLHFNADSLKEIEYAGLLHDFGKVGVREQVLVKAKKLYEPDRELVLARFDVIRRSVEAESLRKKFELAQRAGWQAAQAHFAELDHELAKRLAEVDEQVAFILKANEPTVMAEGSFERLEEIARQTFVDPRGEMRPFLLTREVEALRLPRGSLTVEERLEIESHVVHTYNFLETIPWGRRLGAIPTIAGSHHEKLDGTGYPRGLKSAEIRVESKMMAIADIFDALTASDRPYKKAVPLDKALDILGFEVKGGKCDPELLRIFIESKVWSRVLP
jgi:HD-GYP domain-containing protein (c-di-GMP phosphodiesterase class II)